jgi:hypothetical protein
MMLFVRFPAQDVLRPGRLPLACPSSPDKLSLAWYTHKHEVRTVPEREMQRGERAKHRMPDVQLLSRSTLIAATDLPCMNPPVANQRDRMRDRSGRYEEALAVMVDKPFSKRDVLLCLNFFSFASYDRSMA